MRIIRAPLRISLFGGGTDFPEYYTKHGATIISFAIDQFVYVIHNRRPTGGYRVSYSLTEELCSLTSTEHTLVRAMAARKKFLPCTITMISDVPKGTGLGSSSALSACLCMLMDGTVTSPRKMAQQAYELERSVSPVGIQDHLAAAYGGFNAFHICEDGDWIQEFVPYYLNNIVEDYGMLLYTGRARDANAILRSGWRKGTRPLRAIQQLAREVYGNINDLSVFSLAEYLDETWRLKCEIGGVCDSILEQQYQTAKEAGALGGKLCGAGAGGCWFLLCERKSRSRIVEALGLPEIPFGVERLGVREWRPSYA